MMGAVANEQSKVDAPLRALSAALVYSGLSNLDLPLRVIRNDDGSLTVREPQQVQTDLYWFFEGRKYLTSFLQCMESMECEQRAEEDLAVVQELVRQRKVFAKAIERGKIRGPFYRGFPGEMEYRPSLFVHVGELRYKRRWYKARKEAVLKAALEKRLHRKLKAIARGGILKGRFVDFVRRTLCS